ncbi:MAG: hypothetical protein ACM3U1_01800 [Chloroflexota bacterium]
MKQLLIIAIISISAFACGKDDSSPDAPNGKPSVLIPLAVGNTWYYESYYVHSLTPTDTERYDSYIEKISRKEKIAGEDWYYITADYNNYAEFAPITNRSKGVYGYEVLDGYPFTLIYKYPTFVGDRPKDQYFDRETTSIDAKIKVAAGEFVCVKYEQHLVYEQYDDIGTISYYCPDVGLILISHIVEITGGGAFLDTTWSHSALTKYVLK